MGKRKTKNNKNTKRRKRRSRRGNKPKSIQSGAISLKTAKVSHLRLLSALNTNPYDNPQYNCVNIVSRMTDLNGLPSILLKYYEWYRIVGVKVYIDNMTVMKNQALISGATGSDTVINAGLSLQYLNMTANVLVFLNRDGTSFPTNATKDVWLAAKDNKSVRYINAIKPLTTKTYKYKPNVLDVGYESMTNTAYSPVFGKWIRNNDAAVPHYGVTLIFKMNSYYRESYRIRTEMIIQYKDACDDPKLSLSHGLAITCPYGADARDNSLGPLLEVTHDVEDMVAIQEDHDPDEGPNDNGYDEVDLTETG